MEVSWIVNLVNIHYYKSLFIMKCIMEYMKIIR